MMYIYIYIYIYIVSGKTPTAETEREMSNAPRTERWPHLSIFTQLQTVRPFLFCSAIAHKRFWIHQALMDVHVQVARIGSPATFRTYGSQASEMPALPHPGSLSREMPIGGMQCCCFDT